MRAALLLVALAPQCEASPCVETYKDFTPAGENNRFECDHPQHRIETEDIKEGTYVRRVKVICRCSPPGTT